MHLRTINRIQVSNNDLRTKTDHEPVVKQTTRRKNGDGLDTQCKEMMTAVPNKLCSEWRSRNTCEKRFGVRNRNSRIQVQLGKT